MSSADQISLLISECLERCRARGFTLAVLAQFLKEMGPAGYTKADVKTVDSIMRHLLVKVVAPECFPGDATAQPQPENGAETIRVIGI